jgi:putative transposase
MPYRKDPLVTGNVYHILTKSIAGFKIFNINSDFLRIKRALQYYQVKNHVLKFSQFLTLKEVKKKGFDKCVSSIISPKDKNLIQIVAYCTMPTHLHLILKQLKENGISIFMGNLLNSYSRYFNVKYKRKGPLWEGRFKSILIESDEYLLHLTRYIHLNPTTANLVRKPEDWKFSSYREYISNKEEALCDYSDLLDISRSSYKKFVENRISYQKELHKIKHLVLE